MPHTHSGPPSVPTVTWPISPAAKCGCRASAGRREQSRADAAADLDEQHVVTGAAERVLGEHGRVRIVGDEDGQVSAL